MTSPDDELDHLLRSHLSSELDPQRGRAAQTFERRVTAPMQRRLRQHSWHARVSAWRHWAAIGMAMAGCMAFGAFLPSILGDRPTDAPADEPIIDTPIVDATLSETTLIDAPLADTAVADAGDVIVPELVEFEQTTILHHTDAGPVTLEDGVPGRRVLQQRYDAIRYVDPTGHGEFQYFVPAPQQDLIYPVQRQ